MEIACKYQNKVILTGVFLLCIALPEIYSQDMLASNEIGVDYYIAQVAYDTSGSGGYQLVTDSSIQEGIAYLQIGFQAPPEYHSKPSLNVVASPSVPPVTIFGLEEPVPLPASLPPSASSSKNLCFVIDRSGSMEGKRLALVKEMFRNIMNDIKGQDFISVVIFNNTAEVLIEPRHIRSQQDRNECIAKIDALQAHNGTQIYEGIKFGYQAIERNYQNGYINRVLLLTDGDGQDDKDKVLNLVREKHDRQNITTISTIALSAAAASNFMAQIADSGGGLSISVKNFASDDPIDSKPAIDWLISADKKELLQARENLQNTSRSGVLMQDTIVSTTWNVTITAALDTNVQVLEAGAVRDRTGNRITYALTLHNREYKTIMLTLNINKAAYDHSVLGRLSVESNDSDGNSYTRDYAITLRNETERQSTALPNTSGLVNRTVIIHNYYRTY
ncbi:MAG: VWA domain-containing protein [Treponema sp.]|jgi:uncharacterized protein YegL|nr:VWA domain-containing protein [Treponema sp.]